MHVISFYFRVRYSTFEPISNNSIGSNGPGSTASFDCDNHHHDQCECQKVSRDEPVKGHV